MEKENEIYRKLLTIYETVVSEQHFIDQDNTITSIDIGIFGDMIYLIQIKHGTSVNTTKALKAFCYDCSIYNCKFNESNKKIFKIWYTEFPIIDEAFKAICIRENIIICSRYLDLINTIEIPRKNQTQIQLRDYQLNAVNTVLLNKDKSGIIVFPPGCGKTITALEICMKLHGSGIQKLVWTTRRKELLIGGFNDIVEYKGMPVHNMLNKNGKYNDFNNPGLYIVNHDRFTKLINISDIKPGYIIVDECHESGASGIYNTLKNLNIPMLGLSATPYTGDVEHQNNVRRLFPKIFYELNIFDAIERGYAIPLEFIFNRDVVETIKRIASELPWFKAIAWCSTIDNCNTYAQQLYNELSNNGIRVFSSHSKNDLVNKSIMDFKNCQENCILVCVNKAREGWNDPRINCVVHLDEVQNRAFHVSVQTGNRANRVFPGKTRAIVIDCVARDPVEVILKYYFSYNSKNLFKKIHDKLQVRGSSIYYSSAKLLDVNSDDLDLQFTINDYISEIQQRIFGKSEYQKFVSRFQEYLFTIEGHDHIYPSYGSYLEITKDHDDFLPNPELEFGRINWSEVFGKPSQTIMKWNDFKHYCTQEYTMNPNKTNLPEFYKWLYEKNNILPENPANAYPQNFRNFPDLFEIDYLF